MTRLRRPRGAKPADLLRHELDLLKGPCGDRNPHSRIRELTGDVGTDPASAPGDERDPVPELILPRHGAAG